MFEGLEAEPGAVDWHGLGQGRGAVRQGEWAKLGGWADREAWGRRLGLVDRGSGGGSGWQLELGWNGWWTGWKGSDSETSMNS